MRVRKRRRAGVGATKAGRIHPGPLLFVSLYFCYDAFVCFVGGVQALYRFRLSLAHLKMYNEHQIRLLQLFLLPILHLFTKVFLQSSNSQGLLGLCEFPFADSTRSCFSSLVDDLTHEDHPFPLHLMLIQLEINVLHKVLHKVFQVQILPFSHVLFLFYMSIFVPQLAATENRSSSSSFRFGNVRKEPFSCRILRAYILCCVVCMNMNHRQVSSVTVA